MAFQTSENTSINIRHRIQEITIQPITSERSAKLEILVDGRSVHKLSTIEPGKDLHWEMQTYPCDVHPGSTIGLRLIEKHQLSPNREVLVEYRISDVANQTSITKDAGTFPSGLSALGLISKKPTTASVKPLTVTVKFMNLSQITTSYSDTFIRATKLIEETQGPLNRLGNFREVLKTIVDFGAVVAELHPTAKLVVGLCTMAWEHLEKIQEQHEDLQRLIDGLKQMQPFIDSVKNYAKEAVLKPIILALLLLIEDASNYIINSMHQTSAGQKTRGLSDTRNSYRTSELLQQFGDLKEQFDRGIGVQVLKQVLSAEQRALINQLKPAAPSLNSTPTPCHEGTRVQTIADICAWSDDTNNPQKLLWLYGQAGMGKSSIAASICQVLHDAGTIGAHFFFRRDDPYLRSPEHMLNVIVHRLAFQCEPYGWAVANAIEGYSGLLDMPLGQRYVHLVERPLQSLESSAKTQLGTFIIVVDALDECENTNSHQSLFTGLRKMSQLVPWIKILITSRPDEDIGTVFDSANYSHVVSRSIASYDASSDILMYTQTRMNGMANLNKLSQWPEDLVQELSARAAGLFIWVETACKFIERGADMKTRLEQVLAGTQPAEGSAPLDLLYATAIKQGMGDQGLDNMRVFRECIGAIVATGSRMPLPIGGLGSLLSGHVSPGVFRRVVSGLGSILYEDASQGGAVRVYHPSFADFILDPSRSGSFYTDPYKQNTVLADCSLRAMMRELRFNICGLETSHLLNRDITDLETRVQAAIGPHLTYSCLHWSSHLTKTLVGTLQGRLEDFLYGPQLLYWIEAMSLLGQTSAALSTLLELINWVSNDRKDHSRCANDAYRFILTFYDAISESTPHLYITALPFAPTGSMLAQRIRPLFPNTFVATSNKDEEWPTWLQSIPHNDGVFIIASSANGRRIVSGCWGDTVQVWDSETGAAISEPLPSHLVCCVAISSNGQRIASGSQDGMLRVWDVATGAALGDPVEHHGGRPVLSLTLSSDSRILFSVNSHGNMLVWDTYTKAQVTTFLLDYSHPLKAAAVSPDKYLAASCYENGVVIIWDIRTGASLTGPILSHSDPVYCVTFSPDGRIIATGSEDETVRLWDVSTGRAIAQPMTGHSGDAVSVAFSPDGQYVVSGSMDKKVRLWDLKTGMLACDPLIGHLSGVVSVAFCSDGRRVISASGDKTILIWDVVKGVIVSKSRAGHTYPVTSVAFSPDSRYIASGSEDGTIRVWDAQSGDEAFTPMDSHLGSISFVAFILDSRWILSLAGFKTVQIHHIDTGVVVVSFALSSSADVRCIALSPNGQRLASVTRDGQVGLWDAKTGDAVLAPVATYSHWVSAIAFSPDDHFIASISYNGIIQIWDAETGTAVGEPLGSHSDTVLSVCFSPDSRRIAVGFSDSVQAWDTVTGNELFEPSRGHRHWAWSIAFAPNGRHIVSSSIDETVRIWDAETGAAVADPLKGHSAGVSSIAFSPNGSRIATGSGDSTVRVWDMENLRTHDQFVVGGFFAALFIFAHSGEQIEDLFTAPLKRLVSTSVLAHYINKSGWVTSSSGALLLWLPKQRQRVDDSLIQISIAPTSGHMLLDFSRFAHGGSWASVAGV